MKAKERLATAHFSTPVAVLLAFVTLGLYSPVWYFTRREFFRAVGRGQDLGALLWVNMAASLLNLGLAFMSVFDPTTKSPAMNFVSLVASVVALMIAFRSRRLLEAYFSRIGMPRRLSGLGTFFFQFLYLQYKINQVHADLESSGSEVDASVFD